MIILCVFLHSSAAVFTGFNLMVTTHFLFNLASARLHCLSKHQENYHGKSKR